MPGIHPLHLYPPKSSLNPQNLLKCPKILLKPPKILSPHRAAILRPSWACSGAFLGPFQEILGHFWAWFGVRGLSLYPLNPKILFKSPKIHFKPPKFVSSCSSPSQIRCHFGAHLGPILRPSWSNFGAISGCFGGLFWAFWGQGFTPFPFNPQNPPQTSQNPL